MTIIRDKFNNSKAFFNTHKTKNLKFRKQQLKLLSKNIKNHENELLDALYKDLGKSKVEAYATEIGMLLKSIKLMRKELKNWSKTKQTDTPLYLFPTKSYIKKEPYGTVLIIGPFNYPVQLVFEPLIGAIAAGNTAIVKPSELTPHVAIVIKDIIEDTFDEAYVSVVEGGIEETQTLLSLPFDYMFFTGSEKVGKIVYEAAARKLIPVTLELGGKSPVIVDDTANIKVASERISFGKFTNAGQTCVAPDYILVQRKVKNDLIKALKKTITEFYGENIEKSPDFGRIVNQKHFNRLNDLIQIHKDNVVFGGNSSKEDLYIEPTLLDNITNDNKIMKEEIFGPILPIITYDNFDEVLEIIQSKSKPLSLYLFSEDENMTHRVVEELSFGGGAINDTLMHLANPNLPFGGVGSSGIGQYHGKYSFDTFSHMKSYTFKSTRLESSLFFPPYKGKFKYIKTFFKN
ncbi:aldehyde dehydrogenase [Staphylococcus epidermidis]|jgi:aldehyde dehydrogenase (NAD(+))|uniref:Aldehyde dehydrogenase n=5 Tax=Staphylococcus epidermidis TaxID=1282 RepID=A0A2G7HXP3_STAEP|nr:MULTISPECIES: aldehyde dehydrogenase [Staphylococcus]EHR90878.1 aldehyde dehydrogenase (NAD) family protein [Staphylococcus epidermidis VCU123]EID36268.1 aldehyde dehydrogenase (NAD) family protein [Staphylococcus epidermidis IS-250]EJD83869.1 aldehyde dehydrogenase [Staphylococcus epidermidis NIHLM070]EON81996.1 aldehyde dehydrogenase [Staphylococcus epidermidis 41tr]EON83968.1 aldehyde dehydrogenase [Staphylococcus epidermidis 528m]EON86294.1 aldehyde dehydrogenase [Staphylococcus epider